VRQPFLVIPAAIALAAVACSKQPEPPSSQAASAPRAAAPAAAAPAATSASTISGSVLETMDAASYTYVRIKSGESAVWAAAPQFAVKVGDRVTVPLEMPMKNFHSQALNRDFPLIYFVSKIAKEGEPVGSSAAAPAAPAMPTMMSGHATSAASEPAAAITEPIAQPAGGTTIADLWAKRKELAGKQVTVRGRVMKFNPGILGKDWIHLQDGTGKAEDRTHDITVMAAEGVNVKVGETVTLSGTVVLDKDLGSGYVYPAAIDNARLVARQ
jgi:hypothetical protein